MFLGFCVLVGGNALGQAPADTFGRPLRDDSGPLWHGVGSNGKLVRIAGGALWRVPTPDAGEDGAAPAPPRTDRTGSFTIGSWTSLHPGSWSEAVAIGDLTADGRPDVVLTTTYYFDPPNDLRVFV